MCGCEGEKGKRVDQQELATEDCSNVSMCALVLVVECDEDEKMWKFELCDRGAKEHRVDFVRNPLEDPGLGVVYSLWC